MALPETTEVMAWGHPNFKAGNKMFVAFEQYGGEPSIAFRLSPEQQRAVLADDRFFAAPHGGKSGWTCLKLEKIDWNEIDALVHESYLFVANQRMIELLDVKKRSGQSGRSRKRTTRAH